MSTGEHQFGDFNRDGKVSKWELAALGLVAIAVLQAATWFIEACAR